MSDTPRTDAAAVGFARLLVSHEKFEVDELIRSNFARQLERELTAERSARERIEAKARILSEFVSSRQCPDHSGKWERGRCLQCELEKAKAELAEYRQDAERWRVLCGDGLTYSYDPLHNAGTGAEDANEVLWHVYWRGPKHTFFRDAIDEARNAPEGS